MFYIPYFFSPFDIFLPIISFPPSSINYVIWLRLQSGFSSICTDLL